jgi:hypothetical protein
MSTTAEAPEAPPRRRRSALNRAGLLAIGVLSVAFATICTTRIVLTVWFPERPPWDVTCRTGVDRLLTAVERARAQAAIEPTGERAALEDFRNALEPEWTHLATVRDLCQGDQAALRGLRTVELLRYAEERAVRYEALDLSRLRQRVPTLRKELTGPKSQ